MSDVTQLLNAIEAGEPKAADKLLPLVYEELRKLAVVRMANACVLSFGACSARWITL